MRKQEKKLEISLFICSSSRLSLKLPLNKGFILVYIHHWVIKMTLLRTINYKGIDLKYFITEKSGEFGEYGIYVSYGEEDWEVEALSSDIEFVTNLINELADTCTMPEFVQEICEEALLEQVFIDFRRENES